jgi:hypothetical protein
MIELVPLPLLNTVPGIGEPGIMIVCGPPGDPVTRPAPRDVATLGGAVTVEGEEGATGDWNPGAPPGGWICAIAGPVIAARSATVASWNLFISCTPEAGPPGEAAAGFPDNMGCRSLHRQNRARVPRSLLVCGGQARGVSHDVMSRPAI